MAKVIKNEDNLKLCSCPVCPSYNECASDKDEKLYCSAEVTIACEYKMNGCICGACPVHQASNLANGYYCIKGSAEKNG